MPAGTPGGSGLQQQQFEIEKADLSPLASALSSGIISAFKSAKNVEQAGTGIAAAVQKYVEGVVALIEKESQEQASTGAAGGSGGAGAGGI